MTHIVRLTCSAVRPETKPTGYTGLLHFFGNLSRAGWGVEAPPASLADNLAQLETLAHLCTTSKRTPEDMAERNTLRKAPEREVRDYLQGYVMRNKKVTDKDRIAMGLLLRDTTPTPVGDPVGQADSGK